VTEENKDIILENGYSDAKLLGYVGLTNAYSRVPLLMAFNPELVDHFYTANSRDLDAKGPTMNSADLQKLVELLINDYIKDGCKIYATDNVYFCPTEEVAQEIIDNSMVDHQTYVTEVFDCDDFAHMLKSAFIVDAYENGKRTIPYCFGMALGMRNEGHMMNILIVSDGVDYQVKFVEPSTGQILDPDIKEFHSIQMMIF
jgi:hypothetical protein